MTARRGNDSSQLNVVSVGDRRARLAERWSRQKDKGVRGERKEDAKLYGFSTLSDPRIIGLAGYPFRLFLRVERA